MPAEPFSPPPPSDVQHQPPIAPHRPSSTERIVALLEVLLCSDYPTQLALGSTLAAFGFHGRGAGGGLDVTYVVVLSLADSLVLVALIAFFLSAHGESFTELLFGRRPIA